MSLDTIHRRANIFLTSRSPQRTVWPRVSAAPHDPVSGSLQSAQVRMTAMTHKSQLSPNLGAPPPPTIITVQPLCLGQYPGAIYEQDER